MSAAVDMRVRIGSLELRNPVMTASGTFGSGREYADFIDLSRLGAVVTKSAPALGNVLRSMEELPQLELGEALVRDPFGAQLDAKARHLGIARRAGAVALAAKGLGPVLEGGDQLTFLAPQRS